MSSDGDSSRGACTGSGIESKAGPDGWIGDELQNGGAERDRTVDLLNAIQALSQLSYSPTSTTNF
jgi:hypothetical protein